jgi:hypothetical protein
MKKIISSLFIAVTSLTNTPVIADPITHYVAYVCPQVDSLGNFGSYIGGYGSETLSARTTNPVYFQSRKNLNTVSGPLNHYLNSGTNYDGPAGYVTCSYSSNYPSDGDFDLTYTVTNGKGGHIQSRTNNTIGILFYVGLKD